MTPKSLIIFAGITAISVIAAGVAVVDRADEFSTEAKGVTLFPALADNANNVAKIIVTSKDEAVVIDKGKDNWLMESKGGYPVGIGKVRKIIAGLATIRLLEKMTADPKKHSKLEVEDVTNKDANSKMVELQGSGGKTMAKVIIGKLETITSHANVPGLYVRKPGDNQSWRAEGEMIIPSSAENWLVSDVIDVKKNTVKRISFRDDGKDAKSFSVQRAAADKAFTLEPKPEKGALKQDKAKDLEDLLDEVELQDVRKRGKIQFTTNVRYVTVETFDSLKISLDVLKLMDKYWVNFKATAVDDKNAAAVKRAEAINKKVQDWTYEIIDWKGDKYITKYKDLVDEKAKAGS
ncbi:MAG: DUF4340 domain-containing protein [Rhodospirillaceae bacterium]|jgi:hypothetical protein